MPKRTILLLLLLGPAGCARDRGQITPTTTGTDFQAAPKGEMDSPPFPGTDLAGGPGSAGGRTVLDRSAAHASTDTMPTWPPAAPR